MDYAEVLWDQIAAEEICAGRMTVVARSSRISDEDRADLMRLVLEEGQHGRWLRQCAKKYGEPVGFDVQVQLAMAQHRSFIRADCPEALMATIYIPERYATKTLGSEARLFESAGDQETAECLYQIQREELEHARIDSRILHNLMQDAVVGDVVREWYRTLLRSHYRKGLYQTIHRG